MIYDILFVVCGVGLIAMGVSLFKLNSEVESWKIEVLRLMRLMNAWDDHRLTDNARVGEAFERIQDLVDRLEAHAAELTEYHNKIDTLEINGSVYESLFEQQGLWGEETAEHPDGSEALEFPDPEDEGIII